MEIRREALSLLQTARQRITVLTQERESLETLVAALELASENGNLDGGAPEVVGDGESEVGNGEELVVVGGRKRSPMKAKAAKGEMRKAVLEAFGHYDGRGVSALSLSKYIAKHKPSSLKRSGLSLKEIHKRVTNELFRMKVTGEVTGEGSRMERIWSMKVGDGGRRRRRV